MFNTMREPVRAPAMPVNGLSPKFAEDRVEEVSKLPSSAISSSSTTKAKTIFSWLKSATRQTFDNPSPESITADSKYRSGGKSDAEGPREGPASADATLREFRGVQSLRHLWNKRISANEESNRYSRSKSLGSSKVGKLTKSVSCLVNATGVTDPAHHTEQDLLHRRQAQAKRAHSLHDCTQLEEIEQAAAEAEIDYLHREKDNFYKYKTAEQASKHLAREAKVRAKTRRLSAGIAVGGTSITEDAHFPAIETGRNGDHIHWLKRSDIVLKPKNTAKPPENCNATQVKMAISDRKANNTSSLLSLSAASDVISNRKLDTRQAARQTLAAAGVDEQQTAASNGSDSDTLTAASSPEHTSRARILEREASSPNSKRGSLDSSASSSNVTITSGRSAKRTSSASVRKYSFKTHAHTKSYYSSRKMHNAKEGGVGGSGGAGFSMVAKLTQQFNEIIQKDGKLLEEVKRKNGVLMARGGHIYKVVPNTASPNLSRKVHRTKEMSPRTSMVQRNIKKFETRAAPAVGTDIEKPRVPAKSLNVLRKRTELVQKKGHGSPSGANNTTSSGKQTAYVELQLKLEPHKSHLEVVTEEAKTPLDAEEKSIAATAIATNGLSHRHADEKDTNCERSQHSSNTNVNTANQVNGIAQHTQTRKIVAEQIETQLTADKEDGKTVAATQQKGEKTSTTQTLTNGDSAVAVDADFVLISLAETVADGLPKPTQNIGDDLDGGNDEKAKQRKHKYAKIYEKFRFRSPFSGGANKKSPSKSPEKSTPKSEASSPLKEHSKDVTPPASPLKEYSKDVLPPASPLKEHSKDVSSPASPLKEYSKDVLPPASPLKEHSKDVLPPSSPLKEHSKDVLPPTSPVKEHSKDASPPTPSSALATPVDSCSSTPSGEPDAKILAALKMLNQKLKDLSTETVDDKPIVVAENDDFEQRVLPNSSFVYQASSKLFASDEMIAQAVNVALVNSIEGEQMIMEQKEIQMLRAKAAAAACRHKNSVQDEDAIYEPIAQADIESKTETDYSPQSSFIFKSCANKPKDASSAADEDIYQTLDEVVLPTNSSPKPAEPVANPMDDYESIAGSCEQHPPQDNASAKACDDGYEVYEPPPPEPTSPQPAVSSTIIRNTTDELPELPKPKRRLPKSPMPGKRTLQPAILAGAETLPAATSIVTKALDIPDENDDHHYYADDENIYDTIKGSHCYESLHSAECVRQQQKSGSKSSDSVSLTSNYETITHYRSMTTHLIHHGQPGPTACSSSGSTLTISSDHKTNSLYEVSLAAGLLYGGPGGRLRGGSGSSGGSSKEGGVMHAISKKRVKNGGECGNVSGGEASSNNYSHSNGASSDNSDGWVDISDNELEGGVNQRAKQEFIVVRERSKIHRSPDWSKRVRDKRLHQKKAIIYNEDDSDHYYESLSPLGNKRSTLQTVQRSNSHHKRNQDLPRYVSRFSKHSAVTTAHISDDYDSFDTDTDDHYDAEEHKKHYNDSGVDMRNIKLPDPPAPTNQVYAIVKKFKNFISSKKSPGSGHKHGGSQQKIYENSSQFYVESNSYTNEQVPKNKLKSLKSPKSPKKTATAGTMTSPMLPDDIYENTEFHTLPTINAEAKTLSTSEKNLSTAPAVSSEVSAATLRVKPKSGKSFKSRIRKSLVGSTFDTKQLPTLTSTRSTFYLEDPNQGGYGELDSGFSEKASSGDLGVNTPTDGNPESQKFATVARKAKKESRAANSQRRRTTSGIRPHEPPPPPPDDGVGPKAKPFNTMSGTTSWYAECGVFKNGTSSLTHDEHSLSGSKSINSHNSTMLTNGTSWYAEVGLYQTSGVSVASASSSGSSGVSSTGNEGSVGDEMSHSMFQNEPLYQIYSATKLQALEDQDGSTDGYEEIGHNGCAADALTRKEENNRKSSRPTALQLVEPRNGPSRTLWSEIPEVINSCILPTLTPRERGLQEAKFEIVTSEASYLKSLNLLRSHFMNHPPFRDTSVLSGRDRKALFAHIIPVHECSERLLTELESCWQDNIMLLGLSQRIYAIAEKYFNVYISFCEHQGRMDRTLRRLKETKNSFAQNLELLESSASCCGLNLHSFLMLPMQRITRLPLLIDAVFSKLSPSDDEYERWKLTLAIMNKTVTQCNEAANRCEQAYEIERISRQLEFPSAIRALAIAPAGIPTPGAKPRFLVKKGELTHLIWRGDDAKLTFGKKFTKTTIYAFLFSDLLVLTKRKAEEQFTVFDYCPRNMLTITTGDVLPQLPTKDINQTGKNLILMTLLENHDRKTVELVLSCPSVSEQERWLQATRPPEAETPGEKLYEEWDCPQVIVKHGYDTNEPDGLGLEVGDVINVKRKLPDGWYQGERIRDGAVGWFPGSYTDEVNSAHVRARNLRQRHRLLTFTATYLEAQKRK